MSKRLVDDKEYWKSRHSRQADLKASGVKSVGLKSNHYIYKILADQYKQLLNTIDLSGAKRVLDCGFGDGYFLKFYTENFPDLDVYGIDISPAARNKIDFLPSSKLFVGEIAKFKSEQKFDIVHSFDVLYHILGDQDYRQSLNNMASLSDRYIILHERFLSKAPLISSKHVYMRPADFTNQILNSNGFYLTHRIPTHFIAMRMFTYKLNKFMPKFLYGVDRHIVANVHPSAQERLGSHYINVYSKR